MEHNLNTCQAERVYMFNMKSSKVYGILGLLGGLGLTLSLTWWFRKTRKSLESKFLPAPESETVTQNIPIIHLPSIIIKKSDGSFTERGMCECKKVIESLHKYGIIIVKDPRISAKDNDKFLDMMEFYFEQTHETKMEDSRPKLHYQVGVTPEKTEQPKPHCNTTQSFDILHRPVSLCPPEKDSKWRFFWRIGERPKETAFSELNAEPVVPKAFKIHWGYTMDTWGNDLLQSVKDVSQAISYGLHLPIDYLAKKMKYGPHLLAPTGTDLNKYNKKNNVMAGYHYDLNFITCHGKSRYPGLYIWLRDGTKMEVKIPKGCLLMQAGKQLEWITGGYILAGYHEVVVNDNTLKKMQKRKSMNKSLWRVSSTLFSHLRSDDFLEPLPQFKNDKYPRILVGDQVKKELEDINLASPSHH